MNVGIILYSKTGNTLSIAEELKTSLASSGHNVSIHKVEANENNGKLILTSSPDPSDFEVVIFASPVHTFSLAPVMSLYLKQNLDLHEKPIYSFVTQHFKHKWLGGNRSNKQMKALCERNGGTIKESFVVNWSNPERYKQISSLIEDITQRLN